MTGLVVVLGLVALAVLYGAVAMRVVRHEEESDRRSPRRAPRPAPGGRGTLARLKREAVVEGYVIALARLPVRGPRDRRRSV